MGQRFLSKLFCTQYFSNLNLQIVSTNLFLTDWKNVVCGNFYLIVLVLYWVICWYIFGSIVGISLKLQRYIYLVSNGFPKMMFGSAKSNYKSNLSIRWPTWVLVAQSFSNKFWFTWKWLRISFMNPLFDHFV